MAQRAHFSEIQRPLLSPPVPFSVSVFYSETETAYQWNVSNGTVTDPHGTVQETGELDGLDLPVGDDWTRYVYVHTQLGLYTATPEVALFDAEQTTDLTVFPAEHYYLVATITRTGGGVPTVANVTPRYNVDIRRAPHAYPAIAYMLVSGVSSGGITGDVYSIPSEGTVPTFPASAVIDSGAGASYMPSSCLSDIVVGSWVAVMRADTYGTDSWSWVVAQHIGVM